MNCLRSWTFAVGTALGYGRSLLACSRAGNRRRGGGRRNHHLADRASHGVRQGEALEQPSPPFQSYCPVATDDLPHRDGRPAPWLYDVPMCRLPSKATASMAAPAMRRSGAALAFACWLLVGAHGATSNASPASPDGSTPGISVETTSTVPDSVPDLRSRRQGIDWPRFLGSGPGRQVAGDKTRSLLARFGP